MKLDLLTVGSWAIFDHILLLPRMPHKGETLNISSSVFDLDKILWGGCSFNSAVTASKLGLHAGVIAVEGQDFLSKGYNKYLENLGVDISGVIILPDERSGHGFLLIDKEGNSIVLGNLGAALLQETQSPNPEIIKNSRALIVTPTFDNFTLKACQIGKKSGVVVAVNGSLTTWPEIAPSFVNAIDILFCNKFEVDSLINLLGLIKVEDLFNFGLTTIIITLGEIGCKIITRDFSTVVPAVKPRKFVDQTGAGDAFVGATMSGLLMGFDLVTAARIGNTVGSFIVEERGAQTNIPDWTSMEMRYIENYGAIPKPQNR